MGGACRTGGPRPSSFVQALDEQWNGIRCPAMACYPSKNVRASGKPHGYQHFCERTWR